MTFAMFRVMALELWRDRGALVMTFLLPPLVFLIFSAVFSGATGEDIKLQAHLVEQAGLTLWAEVIMAGNTPILTKATLVDGELDAGILPTGQVVGVIDDLPTAAEVVTRIIAEAETTLDRLAGRSPGS
jgi:hypothetical protein